MNLRTQITNSLTSQSLPQPSPSFLNSLLRKQPTAPVAALTATARARLLAADLTQPNIVDPNWVATHCLPTSTPDRQETKLARDVIVQVLDLEMIGPRSRWDQIEELEAVARGESTRGREVIRVADAETDADTNSPPPHARVAASEGASDKKATHKILLQDCKGQQVYGLELKRVDKIGVGRLHIGEKMLLKRGATLARGVVLLEPERCVALGGKVETWHQAWMEGRLERLKAAVGAGGEGRRPGEGGLTK